MSPDRQILELEIRLLILQYGREAVFAAITALGEQSIDEVQRDVAIAEQDQKRAVRRGPKKGAKQAFAEVKGPPEIQRLVLSLVDSYKRRLFLPRLHDVERFLDHAGVAPGHLKSRTEALPKVTKVLAHLPKTELERLDRDAAVRRESDFALLAEEIVGGRRRTGRQESGTSSHELSPH